MSKVIEMRQKRSDIWDQAKDFLDTHTDANGLMSAEDTAQYERMEKDVVDLGHAIERIERAEQMDRMLNEPVDHPLAGRPDRGSFDTKQGVRSETYKTAFWNHMRGRSNYEVRNALQVGTASEGGYLCPDEFERTLVQALAEENVMRGLVNVITTSSGDRKIPLHLARGNASWIEEEAQIPESDDSFGQITLSAHKVGCMVKISEELMRDSAFDMGSFIAREFARRVGATEEEAIINGDGNHKPTGLLHDTLGAQVGVTTAGAAAITADELIELQHSLKSGYRRKGIFIMNDATIAMLRKLKDGNGHYLWQPNILYGQPDQLLNTRVVSCSTMPLPTAGNKAILYGDYSYYWLADREGRSLARLNELYAATDQIGFKITQRVDGRLILPEAVKCLQMKGA